MLLKAIDMSIRWHHCTCRTRQVSHSSSRRWQVLPLLSHWFNSVTSVQFSREPPVESRARGIGYNTCKSHECTLRHGNCGPIDVIARKGTQICGVLWILLCSSGTKLPRAGNTRIVYNFIVNVLCWRALASVFRNPDGWTALCCSAVVILAYYIYLLGITYLPTMFSVSAIYLVGILGSIINYALGNRLIINWTISTFISGL